MVGGVFSLPLEAHETDVGSLGSQRQASRFFLREFVADAANSLARVAAVAMTLRDTTFNPLVLCGPAGFGKSHLAQCLVSRWRKTFPGRSSAALTGADYVRQFAMSVDADAVSDFRTKYRSAELLLVDGLHELSGKPAAQEELARTIDVLLGRGSFVLVTSRESVTELSGVAEQLASRLSGGLTIQLAQPGIDARREMIRRIVALYGLLCDQEVMEALSAKLSGPFPALRESIGTLAIAQKNTTQVTLSAVHEHLRDHGCGSRPTIRAIISAVARYYRLRAAELRSPSRRKTIVRARGVCVFLARRLTAESLQSIGQHLGGRDHTTVLHAHRQAESLFRTDLEFRRAIDELTEKLVNHPYRYATPA